VLISCAYLCDVCDMYSLCTLCVCVCVCKDIVPTSMPSWMANLHTKFTSSSCPFNVRLFIAKLILNAEWVMVLFCVFLMFLV